MDESRRTNYDRQSELVGNGGDGDGLGDDDRGGEKVSIAMMEVTQSITKEQTELPKIGQRGDRMIMTMPTMTTKIRAPSPSLGHPPQHPGSGAYLPSKTAKFSTRVRRWHERGDEGDQQHHLQEVGEEPNELDDGHPSKKPRRASYSVAVSHPSVQNPHILPKASPSLDDLIPSTSSTSSSSTPTLSVTGTSSPSTPLTLQKMKYFLTGYTFVSELHVGKNKCVFRAIRQRDNLAVVLKVITQKTPEVVASMETEYQLLQKLKSSGITAVVLELLPTGAIVMEDTGGVTGDRLIDSSPEGFYCDIDSFLHLGVELARAVNILHGHRIVHNDIKPRNFLFHGDRVQLLDFDLARRFNDLSPRSDRPQGTLHYLSPEQTGRLGTRPDYRTDLYSLGVVLFQYATGRYPFEQLAGVMELIHATISQPAPSVRQFAPHIPEPIATIIGRLLQKSPDQRYQSAFGVLRDLQHCLEEFRHIGTILTFPLGKNDRPIVYRIPKLLYGREEELEVIQEVYESVLNTGTKHVLLMAGRAGVGKSSLLGPLKQLIQQKKGLFIGGKYEANTKHIPFKAFAQAFSQLVHSLMALQESEIEEHKSSLLAALGTDGQVLLDVIPDLEKVIGAQPPITQMTPVENQNRFVSLFLRFVTKFATRGKPLVLFLDDLHWADSPSLKLFQSIMTSEALTDVLVIGAYRDNEAPPIHPLMTTLEAISTTSTVPIRIIDMKPLNVKHIELFLVDTLSTPEGTKELAALLHQKTLGNPFFLNQYIQAMYDKELLYFNYVTGEWEYDLHEISTTFHAENVASLMMETLTNLSPSLRHILISASCIGAQFSVRLLASAMDRPEAEVLSNLMACSYFTYILQIDSETFKFSHDNIHSAAYSMLEEADRKRLHLKIGRIMKSMWSTRDQQEEHIFDVVGQLNKGLALLDPSPELLELVNLNHQAGLKSKGSTAYDNAKGFIETGLALLKTYSNGDVEKAWEDHHSLQFELYFELSVCLYLAGTFSVAEDIFELLLLKSKTLNEKVDVYLQKLLLCFSMSQHDEATKGGVACLGVLGILIPFVPTDDEVSSALNQVEEALKDRDFSDIVALEPATDMKVPKCFSEMTAPAWFQSASLCALVSARGMIYALENGISPHCVVSIVFLAMTFGIRGKYSLAYELGRLSVAIANRFDNISYKGKVNFMNFAHLNWYHNHVSDDLSYLKLAMDYCLSVYDHVYASFISVHIPLTHFCMGDYLGSVLTEAKKYRDLDRYTIQSKDMGDVNEGFMIAITVLHDPSALQGDYFARPQVLEFEASLTKTNTPLSVCWYNCFKIMALYFLERYEEAAAVAEPNKKLTWSVGGHLCLIPYYTFYALSMLELYPKKDEELQKAYLTEIEECVETLQNWARRSPVNLRAVSQILEAYYLFVVKQEAEKAGLMLGDAIIEADEKGFVYWAGVGSLLLRNIHQKSQVVARHLVSDALNYFSKWGASTISCLLLKRNPYLSAKPTASLTWASGSSPTLGVMSNLNMRLDVETVMKVSNALSQEIVLENLLQKAIGLIQENTSAEKIYLLMENEEKNELEVIVQLTEHGFSAGDKTTQFSNFDESTSEMIRYTCQMKTALSIDNAFVDSRFSAPNEKDYPSGIKAVSCLPIMKRNSLVGVLYLENCSLVSAFVQSRLVVIQAVLPQIAISIENAQLVSKLRATSSELQQKNEELKLEDNRKDQFLAITTHELRTPLHGVIGATSLLMETSNLSLEQQEYVAVIQGSAKSLLMLVNDILDLTRLQLSQLRIESTDFTLHSVIENGLELISGIASSKEIEVEWVFDTPMPEVLNTDPVRLQQILTNLLSNALKFTERGSVIMNFSFKTQEDGEGELEFKVRDTGVGIPLEKIKDMFKLFSQLDSDPSARYGGYGVGLFICQRLLQLLKGSVTALSDGKTGSTFTVTIPVKKGSIKDSNSLNPFLRRIPELNPLVKDKVVIFWLSRHASKRMFDWSFSSVSGFKYLVSPTPEEGEKDFVNLLTNTPTIDMMVIDFGFLETVQRVLKEGFLGEKVKNAPFLVMTFVHTWKALREREGVQPLFKPIQPIKSAQIICNILLASNKSQVVSPAPAISTPAPGLDPNRPLTVLVVEDNVVNNKLLCTVLASAKVASRSAVNGQEAIDIVEREGNNIDAILMDVMMPVMDGITATQELRKRGYKIPIIAATASFAEQDKSQCVAAGMNDILPKPFTKSAVISVLERNLNVKLGPGK